MKRVFLNSLAALAAGFCLRLFFVLKFPANSGDTVLYEQIAANWLKHHVYAMTVDGVIIPVDLRMPGYPAFLALVYALTGRTGANARLWVMLVQIFLDLAACLAIAFLAARLSRGNDKRSLIAALWLAALCPFTANYTAVPLTESFAILFTALAMASFAGLLQREPKPEVLPPGDQAAFPRKLFIAAGIAGFWIGLGALFRPEAPLLLIVAFPIVIWTLSSQPGWREALLVAAISLMACLLPLFPWAIRNAITLHELQFLAPKNSDLPGELVPYGFMAWEKTWLYRVRDCYLVPWKLNEEPIDVEDIPARAFDTPGEKERVAAILEPYNEDLTLTPEEDNAFGKLARERNARHPLRTYLWLPAARAIAIWFTPRIELLPVAGNVFPLARMREEDPLDQEVTIALFLLNIFYVGLGAWGAVRLWRGNAAARPAILYLALFILLRTAFLTTLETPEPRYVLVCFPALIALGTQVFARPSETQ